MEKWIFIVLNRAGDSMGAVTAADFEKKLKSQEIKNIYYIYGRDSGRVIKIACKIKEKVLGTDYQASDYIKISADNFSLSDFLETAEIYPMFTDYNFIEINDFNAESLKADETKRLIALLENIPKKTVILITITGFDVKGGKKVPGAKNKKIIDLAAKYGESVEAELRKSTELYKYIMELAAENGSGISRQNAEKIAELCLGNTLVAENEVYKLSSYANGKEITLEMINDMVSAGLDTNAFALASAVASFNTPQAMKLLDDLVSMRTDSIAILSAISSAFIDLYRASVAISSLKHEADVVSDFSYRGREFVVRNAFRDARKIDTLHLRKCLKILCEADMKCKSTALDSKIIIEKAIAQMLT